MLRPMLTNSSSLSSFFRDFEKNFFSDFNSSFSSFETDIVDKGDSYLLQAELPGFQKEDISVECNNGYLTISANQNEETQESKKHYVRKERRYGSYERSFYVGDVKAESIEAEYKNGVLELKFPKPTEAVSTSYQIEVK